MNRHIQELEDRLARTTDLWLRDVITGELHNLYEQEVDPEPSRVQLDEYAMIGEQRMYGSIR